MPKPKPAAPSAKDAALIFKVASDETRMAVMLLLRDGEKSVTELCAAISQSQPAVSHHLALCRLSGILQVERRGKFNFYSLADKGRAIVAAYDSMAA